MVRTSFPLMERLPDWLVHGVSTVCGLGYSKYAPGTVGSLAGVLFCWLMAGRLGLSAQLGLVAAMFLVGWAFCDESEKRMGRTDPGCIVWDEFAAMPVVFFGISFPAAPWGLAVVLLAGFGLFRFFDILKPLGISKLQSLPGGLGIMVDDTVAGVFSCALLQAGIALFLRTHS